MVIFYAFFPPFASVALLHVNTFFCQVCLDFTGQTKDPSRVESGGHVLADRLAVEKLSAAH